MSYSYDKFLRPITSTDKYIQILDDAGKVQYTVNPFSILNVFVNNNLLKINLKSGRVIQITFNTQNESKLAISRIQQQIDTLAQKIPFNVDKDVENYIANEIDEISEINAATFSVNANMVLDGHLLLTSETVNISGVTYSINFMDGAIKYINSVTTDFQVDFTNVPSIANTSITYTLIVNQGSTPYMITGITVNTVSKTIKWANATEPGGNASQIDIIELMFIFNGSGVLTQVLGQMETFA